MRLIIVSILVVLCVAASPADASEAALQLRPASLVPMQIYGEASAPPGYLQFCRNDPKECAPQSGQARQIQRFSLTAKRIEDLETVNALVNIMVRPVSDADLYGEREFWTYPLKEGDCEDYVLLKRRMLISRGWPASALLITVVRDELGEGHAVLTVSTDHGDLILDNKHGSIRIWSETPYAYIKRQSAADPLVWTALTPSPQIADNFAGVQSRRSRKSN